MKRGINMDGNLTVGTWKNWFKPNVYKIYVSEEISVVSHETLIPKVNLVSEGRYPVDPYSDE